MTNKTLRITAVISFLLLIYVFLVWGNQKEEMKKLKSIPQQTIIDSLKMRCDSLQNLSDSLSSELFPIEIELSRYQMAYKIFMERNPKAAEQYGTIISDETE